MRLWLLFKLSILAFYDTAPAAKGGYHLLLPVETEVQVLHLVSVDT